MDHVRGTAREEAPTRRRALHLNLYRIRTTLAAVEAEREAKKEAEKEVEEAKREAQEAAETAADKEAHEAEKGAVREAKKGATCEPAAGGDTGTAIAAVEAWRQRLEVSPQRRQEQEQERERERVTDAAKEAAGDGAVEDVGGGRPPPVRESSGFRGLRRITENRSLRRFSSIAVDDSPPPPRELSSPQELMSGDWRALPTTTAPLGPGDFVPADHAGEEDSCFSSFSSLSVASTASAASFTSSDRSSTRASRSSRHRDKDYLQAAAAAKFAKGLRCLEDGQHEEARSKFRAALRALVLLHDDEVTHLSMSPVHEMLGAVERSRGQWEKSRLHLMAAREICEDRLTQAELEDVTEEAGPAAGGGGAVEGMDHVRGAAHEEAPTRRQALQLNLNRIRTTLAAVEAERDAAAADGGEGGGSVGGGERGAGGGKGGRRRSGRRRRSAHAKSIPAAPAEAAAPDAEIAPSEARRRLLQYSRRRRASMDRFCESLSELDVKAEVEADSKDWRSRSGI